jgi:hypothetical protein
MATPEQARQWLNQYNAEAQTNPIEWWNLIPRCASCRLPLGEYEGTIVNGLRVCAWADCIGRAFERREEAR